MVTGGVTGEAIPGLSKAEKTEVWAQARVSVSRAAVTKYCKLGDLKQRKFIVSPLWRLWVPNPGAGRAVLSLKSPGENPSFQPLVFASLPCVPWLPTAALCSLPLIPLGHCPHVWASSHKIISHIGFRVTLHQCDLILT